MTLQQIGDCLGASRQEAQRLVRAGTNGAPIVIVGCRQCDAEVTRRFARKLDGGYRNIRARCDVELEQFSQATRESATALAEIVGPSEKGGKRALNTGQAA